MFDPAVVGATVDFLADLAGDGAALELGIGTGRIALPLSARGVPVQGIDLSPDMVAQLQAKPGAEAIGVTIGDFATTVVPGTFRLAYLVYNTIENLTSQDDQVACFVNVGRTSSPAAASSLRSRCRSSVACRRGRRPCAFMVMPDRVGFDTIDVARQLGVSHHYWVGRDGPRRSPCRTATSGPPSSTSWPASAACACASAGALESRPFTSESPSHVSVWEKLPAE